MIKPNVFVCTPHGEKVSPSFNRNLMEMQNTSLDYLYMMAEVESIIVGLARNMLVNIAKDHKADVVLFIDNDVLVPPNTHQIIARALERGVCSGMYFARRPPYTPQIFKLAEGEEYEKDALYWPLMDIPPDNEGLFEADAIGFGCVAIRIDVFETLVQYHESKFKAAGDLIRSKATEDNNFESIAFIVERLSPWFEFLNKRGEDIYFCERAREAGITIWVDPTVKCLHLGEIPLGIDHFMYLKDNNLIRMVEPIGSPHTPQTNEDPVEEVVSVEPTDEEVEA